MMLRVLVEYKVLDVRAGSTIMEARCRAASCRASSRISFGLPNDVIAAVSRHVHLHLDEFSKSTVRWTAGPTKVDP